MKKSILFFTISFILLVSNALEAQNYNYEEEAKRIVKVPNTPEAEAFAKYGNTDVNMYTGTPNISIPIYTILGNELSLPINLSYDASGVKVSQLATGVGLNWNLNVGGRISRNINGLVDDYISSVFDYESVYSNDIVYLPTNGSTGKTVLELIEEYMDPPTLFDTQADAINYFEFLKEIGDNKLDTQPDYFSFNALGISDHFVIDMDNIPNYVALDNPRIKAVATYSPSNTSYIEKWIITNDDGTKFYFDLAEKTKTMGLEVDNSNYHQEYYSSWVLTKIVSPNLTDTYEFEYNDFNGALMANQPLITTATVMNELDHPTDPDSPAARTISAPVTEYHQSQLALTKIKHNGKVVVEIALKNRDDFDAASAIDKIDIKNYNNNGVIKSYKLNHSYFGSPSSNAFSQRLKLDRIDIKSASSTLSSYEFEYFSPASVPSRGSLARDFLGYYNGVGNTVLYPEVVISGISFEGADRSPNFGTAIYGTLKKITYPTGGHTEFEFEPNKTTYTVQDINSSVQNVTYGILSVTANSGGNYTNNECGACCIDQYGNTPNINGTVFTITDPDDYGIEFTNGAGSSGEAYLIKLTEAIKPNAPVVPYDDVIDQSNCNVLADMVWSHNTGNNGDSVYLDIGTYQITLAKGVPMGTSNSISLRVHRDEITNNNTVNTGEVIRAGFRIKSIKDYTASNVLSTEKEYIYKTSINGADSSGEILFNPTYYTIHDYSMFAQATDPIAGLVQGVNYRKQLRRGNAWSGGYRPHVGYAIVYERQKASGEENGYIKHAFSVSPYAGVFSTGVNPNASLYQKQFRTGKETSTEVIKDLANSSLTETVSKSGTGYYDDIHFGNSTLYVYNNPTRNYQYVRIFPAPNNKYSFDFVDAKISGFTGPFGPGGITTATPPTSCNLPNKCLTLPHSTFETRLTYAQGRVGGVLSQSNQQFIQGDTIKTYKKNSYDSSIDYLLRESKSATSHSDTISTKYYYTKDKAGTTVYNDMINKNMLTSIVKTEAYQENNKLATQDTEYKKWTSTVYKPELIKASKGTVSLEERLKVYSYDSKGNPREMGQSNGVHTVYIWGYNKSTLVAKIENVTVSQVEALSYFSSGLTITNGLSTNQENSLLNNLPNAMVTIYRYNDPRIGISNIVDANGNVTTYEYDEFNRLKRIKDSDGNIVSENDYHYKN